MRIRANKAVFHCEFCGSKLKKRTSSLEHRYLRFDVFVCENPVCAASFTGTTELTHILSPSGAADNESGLPKATAYKRNAALKAFQAQQLRFCGDLFDERINDHLT